jgi:energy-coupling factor transporter ATP-binding protein EcfA2
MKVKKLTIKDFTAFRHTPSLEFCPGINIIIGENGMGKSHVLKLIYSVLKAHEASSGPTAPKSLQLEGTLASKLAGVFMPDGMALNRLISRAQGAGAARVVLTTDTGETMFQITSKSGLSAVRTTQMKVERSIFIPSREALSLYEGFRSLYKERLISMDETYADLCDALGLPQLRGPRGSGRNKQIEVIESLIGGKVRLKEERFYVQFNDGSMVEAHLVAEGWRKLGSIAQLMMNGALAKNGILLWDEPEANLNPAAISDVVKVLYALAASGMQVFLSTHDSLLAGEFGLIADYPNQFPSKNPPEIRFIGLHRGAGQISIDSDTGPRLADLEHNPILEASLRHYDKGSELFAKAK